MSFRQSLSIATGEIFEAYAIATGEVFEAYAIAPNARRNATKGCLPRRKVLIFLAVSAKKRKFAPESLKGRIDTIKPTAQR